MTMLLSFRSDRWGARWCIQALSAPLPGPLVDREPLIAPAIPAIAATRRTAATPPANHGHFRRLVGPLGVAHGWSAGAGRVSGHCRGGGAQAGGPACPPRTDASSGTAAPHVGQTRAPGGTS